MISRRGLFGAAAGAAAVPFVRAESRPWTKEEMEAEGRKYDEELLETEVVEGTLERWFYHYGYLRADDGRLLQVPLWAMPRGVRKEAGLRLRVQVVGEVKRTMRFIAPAEVLAR